MSTSPAVERAVQVLDTLAEAGEPVSLARLARDLDLPKSSLFNICTTLLDVNLLVRLEDKRMVIGAHTVKWANAFLARIDITKEFFATWDEMQVLPDETITLSIRDGREVIYIACRNGSKPLGLSFKTGMRIPAVYTATGLAMLSTLPDQSVARLFNPELIDWPRPLTTRGILDLPTLMDELQATRERGYSIDAGGVREGMYCYGAPVFDSHGPEAVAGVAVSILANRADNMLEMRASNAMRRLAQRLTSRLGGVAPSKHAWHRMATPVAPEQSLPPVE